MWQGNVTAESAIEATPWNMFTFWLKWPGDRVRQNDDGFLEPSDETVVRQLCRLNFSIDPPTAGQLGTPRLVCFGAIGFDGGATPNDYELTTFNDASAFSPPHPLRDAQDDWMMRIPANFLFAGNQVPSLEDVFVQSKAKRKMPPGTGVLGVIAMGNLFADDQTNTLSFSVDWRAAVRTGYTR